MPKQMEKFVNISEKLIIPFLLIILSYLLNNFSSQVDGLRKDIKDLSAVTMENRTELAILKLRLAYVDRIRLDNGNADSNNRSQQ